MKTFFLVVVVNNIIRYLREHHSLEFPAFSAEGIFVGIILIFVIGWFVVMVCIIRNKRKRGEPL